MSSLVSDQAEDDVLGEREVMRPEIAQSNFAGHQVVENRLSSLLGS